MAAADGQVVIVFNGEIYNFRELARELTRCGHRFRSHSDTEVLLAMYLEHGTSMLQHLNGIYAFAIWDARNGTLFIARDGFGVKPLYISEAGGVVAFSSEIKAMLVLPWISRTLDLQALSHCVQHLWCPAPRTPLADVRKLEPGEAIVVRDGRIVQRWKHYVPPAPGADAARTPEDWVDEVRTRLDEAVRRQMVADVPLGAFLSGGLDSSAIVAQARHHASGRLQCFTIDFDESFAREEGFARDLPFAQRVAQHLDVDLQVVKVGAEMADELPQMVWQLDEPQADLAALNVLYISRLARSHGIKVLLSGAGGDDLFTGYRRHRALGLDALWQRVPSNLRNAVAAFGHRLPARPPLLRRASRLLAAAGLDGDERIAYYFDWATPATARGLFGPGLLNSPVEQPLRRALQDMPSAATSLQRMLLLEQRYFLADHNLNYTDKMSMAAGVEARVPFLDPDLVDLAARIPDRYRQRGRESKWILKRAMKGILPDEVIYRPKTGFGVPLRAWLRGALRPMLYELLGDTSIKRRGVFDSRAVSRLIVDFESGSADNAYSLLSVMCIELWCRQFVDGAVPASIAQ